MFPNCFSLNCVLTSSTEKQQPINENVVNNLTYVLTADCLLAPGSSAGLQQTNQPDRGHVERSGSNAVPLLATQPH